MPLFWSAVSVLSIYIIDCWTQCYICSYVLSWALYKLLSYSLGECLNVWENLTPSVWLISVSSSWFLLRSGLLCVSLHYTYFIIMPHSWVTFFFSILEFICGKQHFGLVLSNILKLAWTKQTSSSLTWILIIPTSLTPTVLFPLCHRKRVLTSQVCFYFF